MKNKTNHIQTAAITLAFATAALAIACQGLSAAEFFVAPIGNDANPGTEARPFATLERARDEIRKLKQAGPLKEEIAPAVTVGHSRAKDSQTYAVALTQGYGELDCNLAATAATGRCQVVTFTRPVKEGAIARAYLDGMRGAWEEIMGDLPVVARQSAGNRLGERVPAGYHGSQDLYEVLVYDRVLSDDELKSLHSYLLLPRKAETALEK